METWIFQQGTLTFSHYRMWRVHGKLAVVWNQDSAEAIPCIRPDDPLFLVIQGESVGPGSRLHVLEHDVPADSAHGCRLDARERGIPVGPEKDPKIKQKT